MRSSIPESITSEPAPAAVAEALLRKPGDSHMRRSLRAFARYPSNWISLAVIVVGLVMAVIPSVWLPHDPIEVDMVNRLKAPAWTFDNGAFFLGTDVLGRDVWSRTIFAASWTYLVTLAATLLSAVLGTLTGLAAGFYRGQTDSILSRLMDMQLAFPVVLLSIAILAVAGPSLLNMILVLGLTDVARYGRVIRSMVLTIRERDYIEAARAVGASNPRLIFGHILPNVFSPIVVLTTLSAARLMLTESSLSFLGLGVTPPATTWGGMIGATRDYIYRAPWTSLWPGLVITVTVVAINILGDGLRDAFDPQSH